MPVASAAVLIAAAPDSEAFWNATTYIIAQSPRLQESGVMGYCYIASSYHFQGSLAGGYAGMLNMYVTIDIPSLKCAGRMVTYCSPCPLQCLKHADGDSSCRPNGTLQQLGEVTHFLQEYIGSIPEVKLSVFPTQYASVYEFFEATKNTAPVGFNNAVGNRLLDSKALANVTALRAAINKATPPGTVANLNLVAGPGLWAAKPAGGSVSVTPSWRSAYVEYGGLLPLLRLET